MTWVLGLRVRSLGDQKSEGLKSESQRHQSLKVCGHKAEGPGAALWYPGEVCLSCSAALRYPMVMSRPSGQRPVCKSSDAA